MIVIITADELRECRRFKLRARSLEEQLDMLHSAAERMTTALRLAPTASGTSDDELPILLDKIIECEARISAMVAEIADLIIEADEYFMTLSEPQEKIMRARYQDARSWRQVATATHYSIDHCKRINRECMSRLL